MAELARRNHIVPRFYLERFARDSQIGAARLENGAVMVQALKKAATENDYYLVTLEDGEVTDEFEKELSKLEGMAAEVFRKVLDHGIWPLPVADRVLLSEFITIQLLRGRNHRRSIEQTVGLMMTAQVASAGREDLVKRMREVQGREPDHDIVDRLWAMASRPGGFKMKAPPAMHINQMLELVPDLLPLIHGRSWRLMTFRRKRLLTTDTPVVLSRDPDDPARGIGLLNAGAIMLPLSRTTALVMVHPFEFNGDASLEDVTAGRTDIRLPGNAKLANTLNWEAAFNARDWIYFHPDDRDLLPDPLPAARDKEVAHDNVDFVKMGEKMRAARARRPRGAQS